MLKDYEEWHRLKSEIEAKNSMPFFREGEIWWCSLGLNIGTEEDGKNNLFERPVLVFHKFNKDMFFGLPMSSVKKFGKYDCSILLHNRERTILISQMRTLSAKRLIRRIGRLRQKKFLRVIRVLNVFFNNKTDPLRGPRVPQIHPEISDEKS